jgi:hypothetical protein
VVEQTGVCECQKRERERESWDEVMTRENQSSKGGGLNLGRRPCSAEDRGPTTCWRCPR